MPSIRTFVFFDVETTGLILKNAVPDITEISLVAVARDHILEAKENDRLPRELNKLLLTVNTEKEIPKKVECMTGLSNANLKYSPFMDKNLCKTINRFLNLFESPICMVAHNGFRFDFPLLNRNFVLHKVALSSEVLCVDSIQLFRDYFKQQKLELERNVNPQPVETSSFVCDQDLKDLLNDKWEQVLLEDCDISTEEEKVARRGLQTSPDNSHDMYPVSPKKYSKTTVQVVPNGKDLAKSPNANSAPHNYKLNTVYTLLVGDFEHALHSAEGDALSLLQCACKIKDFFVPWTDREAVKLNEIRHI